MSSMLKLSDRHLRTVMASSHRLLCSHAQRCVLQHETRPMAKDTRVTSRLFTTLHKFSKADRPSDTVTRLITRRLSLLSRLVNLSGNDCARATNTFTPVYMVRELVRTLQKEVEALSSICVQSGHVNLSLAGNRSHGGKSVQLFSNSRPSLSDKQQDRQQDESSQQGRPDNENDEDDKQKEEVEIGLAPRLLFLATISMLALFLLVQTSRPNRNTVSWSEFVHDMLLKGEVNHIMVRPDEEAAYIFLEPGAVVRNRRVDASVPVVLRISNPAKFEEKLRQTEAELGIKAEDAVPIKFLRGSDHRWLMILLMGLIAFMLYKSSPKTKFPSASDIFPTKAKFVRVDQLKGKVVSFKDVAGLHEAKVEVMEFVDYLRKPDKYKKLGAKIPKGALLLGPPGCGKTLLAKAVASEAKVPFLAMAGSDFVEMVGGLGAARVRDLFKEARQKAPCIIYIDEVDAIGRRRTGPQKGGDEEGEHTLNQLLVEMDGIGTSGSVIVMGSTNRADVLDKALLRAGRFDRHITIDLPTLAERQEIFEMYLSKLKIRGKPENYSERLAQLSPGSSGADIANICNEAALHAARHKKKIIETENFDYAVERVSVGVAKKSRVLSPQEKKVVAYHEAGHALVGWLLQHTDVLLKVSIVQRTNAKLGLSQYKPSDRKLVSKEELFEKMCMMLGGRVAESLTFNNVTSGAQDDLRTVTKLAYKQIRQFGMNERIGLVSFADTDGAEFSGEKPYSKQTAAIIDEEARRLVADVYKQTEKLLRVHKDKLRVVAEALLDKEALSHSEMVDLIGPPPFAGKEGVSEWEVTS